jgi:putative ABC transport system permease protein
MNFVAIRMLTGDRSKYLGLVFTISFASMLMAHQASIFAGLMMRTTSQIQDVRDAEVWVMDRRLRFVDEIEPLTEQDLYRVRGVEGVEWAVRLFKGSARSKSPEGSLRAVTLIGIDDTTLVGAPRKIKLGSIADVRRPDAVIVDEAGYRDLWPGAPLELGRTLEMNDRRGVVVAIADSSPPFQTLPVVYTRYSQAVQYVGRERKLMSFVLAHPKPGTDVPALLHRIRAQTGLIARTRDEWSWDTIRYYLANTGIPVNFGITVSLAFIVGAVVAGQTFYLFTIENLKQFGALKAIGVNNRRLVAMILLQALIVGGIGYGIGMGLAAAFFESTKNVIHLRGFVLRWPIMAGTGIAVIAIIVGASLLSIRRVLVLEPAAVFR